jgi:hypothetical protein
MTDNMSGSSQFALFALIGVGVLACLGDAYTTLKGFDVGLVEGNPVARWLQKKLGFSLSAFVATGFFLVSTSIISVVSPTAAFAIAGGVIALETFNTVRNYLLFKKYSKKK